MEQTCALAPHPVRLHAETAWRMTTRRDPWVNLLRTTIATFSAGIGGADSVLVLPFTAALGLPDAFARRIARNSQHILLEEANLWRVADPAAGAGGFESLTDALCEKAWALFQEIEREGGIVESLARGSLQDRIAVVRDQRERAAATRKDPITGVSAFPNLHEAPVSVLIAAPAIGAAGQRDGAEAAAPASARAKADSRVVPFTALVEASGRGAPISDAVASAQAPDPMATTPLPSTRTAEPFERLRERSDAYLTRMGERPKVFLANLGPVADFTARAMFASFFDRWHRSHHERRISKPRFASERLFR